MEIMAESPKANTVTKKEPTTSSFPHEVMTGAAAYFAKGAAWGATFHVKMTLVVVLIVLDQLIAAKMRKLHKEDEGNRGFFMATHGIVALIMIVIVLMMKTNILGA